MDLRLLLRRVVLRLAFLQGSAANKDTSGAERQAQSADAAHRPWVLQPLDSRRPGARRRVLRLALPGLDAVLLHRQWSVHLHVRSRGRQGGLATPDVGDFIGAAISWASP